jgi:hypothetical protein
MNLIARLKALVNRLLPRASFARKVGILAGALQQRKPSGCSCCQLLLAFTFLKI